MSTNITTILIAIIGVAGTLTAPLLTQLAVSRAKLTEFDMQRAAKEMEISEHRRVEAFNERRSVYVSLHAAARQYLGEIRRDLHTLRARDLTDEERAELVEARRLFREVYANAQMMLPDGVLEHARQVSGALGEAYGKIRRLDARLTPGALELEPVPDRSHAIEEARTFCRLEVYDQIVELRDVMRHDLGVSEPGSTSSSTLAPPRRISNEVASDD